ncbi:tol-pal system protein YbgF [Variovorax sp. J22R133]|uniref:tol-pal system protein YbgF n=1 Tax=Variovorax brevis TaxID=3053503 RepID=UPI0025791859|nr:tol-pal system protein YbgF [Variovorax sp. J22R133]MDM0112375.1 tol-pal system protein YbgF [Variovorax sp. J22R133]
MCATVGAHAALFEDDEARRAILDLRTRVETMRERSTEENAQLRRSLLELQTQIEAMRNDMSRLVGKNEELTKSIADMKQRQNDVDERMKKNEPAKVNVDGREFTADPKEKADFDAALGIFRAGQFPQAQTAFAEFVKRYPQSGYNPSALFWLGNAQYATRNYNEAIANFRSMLSLAPDHAKAPEAVLSIANCQIELKDTKGARRTLEDLAKAYPQSEAAQAGKERLARLK